MATINRNITIDVETYARATQGTDNISKRLSELIEKGLLYEIQEKSEPTLNDCIESLIRAYKNKGVEQTQLQKTQVQKTQVQKIQQPKQKEDNTSFWERADLKKYIDEFSEYDEPFPKHIKEIDELLKLKNKYSKESEDEDEELERLSNLNRIEKQLEELIDSYRVIK